MKKIVFSLSEKELSDHPITSVVKGWYFKVTETSNGCYLVEAKDRYGRVVSRQGDSPELLIDACKKDIIEMFPGIK